MAGEVAGSVRSANCAPAVFEAAAEARRRGLPTHDDPPLLPLLGAGELVINQPPHVLRECYAVDGVEDSNLWVC